MAYLNRKSLTLGAIVNLYAPKTMFGICLILTCMVFSNTLYAVTRTSTTTGGNWNATATWVGGVVPLATDDVIIATTGVSAVTVNVASTCVGVLINSGAKLTSTTLALTVNGPWVNNGTYEQGTATVNFGSANAAINGGTGTANFNNIGIVSGTTMTINTPVTVAGTFIYAAVAATSTVTLSGTNTLAVTGAMTMPRPSAGFTCTFAVGAGTLTVNGLFTMSATTTGRDDVLSISTGTANLSAVTTGTTGCLFTFTGSGILNISGTVSTGPPTITPSTGKVNFSGAAAQNVWGINYYDLEFSGAGTKTIIAGLTANVANHWIVNSPVTMATTAIANVTGNVTGSGNITVGTGTIFLEGSWTNSGTLNPGTGTISYDGAGPQTIAPLSYYKLATATGGTKTLAANVTVSNVLTIGASTTLDLSSFTLFLSFAGTPLVNSGSISGAGIVNYSGSAGQTILGTTYPNLEFSGAGTKTISTGTTITVTNNWIVGSAASFTTTGGVNVTGDISGAGAITMASGIIAIKGDWIHNGTFTQGTSTVNYDGAGAQSVRGMTYYNLQATIGNTKTLAGNTTVNNVLTVSTPATLSLSTFTVTLPLTGSPLVITGSLAGTGKVLYSGANAQTIAATTYYDLEFSGTGAKTIADATTITVTDNWVIGSTTTMAGSGSATVTADISGGGALTMGSGTINLAGVWSKTGSFTAGTGTFNYNGTTQTIATLTYYKLQTSSSGIKTLAANTIVSNVLTINSPSSLDLSTFTLTLSGAGTPLVSNGTFTPSTSTVSFTNAASTNIPAVNFYNLNGTGGPRVLANSGVIGIAGTFTKGAGAYTVTGSTVDFNGAAQTIPAFIFNDLILSGSGAKTILTATTVNVNTIEIQNGPSLDLPGTAQLNITKP